MIGILAAGRPFKTCSRRHSSSTSLSTSGTSQRRRARRCALPLFSACHKPSRDPPHPWRAFCVDGRKCSLTHKRSISLSTTGNPTRIETWSGCSLVLERITSRSTSGTTSRGACAYGCVPHGRSRSRSRCALCPVTSPRATHTPHHPLLDVCVMMPGHVLRSTEVQSASQQVGHEQGVHSWGMSLMNVEPTPPRAMLWPQTLLRRRATPNPFVLPDPYAR